MNIFVVVLPTDSVLAESNLAGFVPHVHAIVPGRVWATGTQLRTGADVDREIGLGPTGGSDATAVILKVGEYNGFAAKSLWEKLSEWSEM